MSEFNNNLKSLFKYHLFVYRTYGLFALAPGASKYKRIASETFFVLLFSLVGSYNVSLIIEFYLQPTILDKLSRVFFCLCTLFPSTVKFLYIRRNQHLYKQNIDLLYNDYYRPRNAVEDDLMQNYFSTNKLLQHGYFWVTMVVLGQIILVHNLTHPEELPIASYTPFDIESLPVFIGVEVHCVVTLLVMCFVNVAHDLWSVSFFLFAKVQLDIVSHRMEHIGSNDSDDVAINLELRTCLRHHADIFTLVEKVDKTVRGPNSLQVFCSVLVLISNFYALSFVSPSEDFTNFFRYFTYQVTMLGQIFLLCYFPNEVTLSSRMLPHALYASNWIFWSKENRKLVLLSLLRLQSPIIVRSVNKCYYFDLAAFTSVVNTAYSYFALLRQMN